MFTMPAASMEETLSLPDKLLSFLEKLSHGTTYGVDESYLDRLLTSIRTEYDKQSISFDGVINWLSTNKGMWDVILKDLNVASFLTQLSGILSRKEKHFRVLEKSGVIGVVMSPILAQHKVSAVRCSYLKSLCELTRHELGRKKIRDDRLWFITVGLSLDDPSMYVRRQARDFLRQFLKSEKKNQELSEEIAKEVMKPILSSFECNAQQEAELEKKITPTLKLIDGLLDDNVLEEHANALSAILVNKFNLHGLLRKWLETFATDSFLDTLVTSYIILILTNLENGDVSSLMDLYKPLLNNKRICAILTLSRVAHTTMCRMKERGNTIDQRTQMHFFMMQVIPFMIPLRRLDEVSFMFEQFVNKVYEMASEETFRMAYSAKELLLTEKHDAIVRKSTNVVHTMMGYHHLMNRNMLVITYQGFSWELKKFIPSYALDQDPTMAEIQDGQDLCVTAAPLLHALLQAISTLIETYHFSWNEALEGICLLKLCHWLLDNPNLPTKSVVLTLKVTRLTIGQCMPPSLALLADRIEETSLEAIGPLLVKKLHDPNWEVRDSALEVIAVISELAAEKYPLFQEFLLSHKFGSLAVAMLEGDAEAYVRASAINVLIAMIPIDKIWDESLSTLQLAKKIQNVLMKDPEAIVRRAAALMTSPLLTHCGRLTCDGIKELVENMVSVTLNDLHWEVRVNALTFWSTVIDLTLQEQGMVDGVFPAVTFSREHKKIMQLTENELKIRLLKALDRLSDSGCLTVLLSALQEDFDEQVVDKAVQVTSQLLNLLKLHHVIPTENSSSSKKRKHRPETFRNTPPERNESSQTLNSEISDDIIEGIINSKDMNLLSGVMTSDSESVHPLGKHKYEKIAAETFLEHIQQLDMNSADEDFDPNSDLASLLNDVLSIHSSLGPDNIPDCY